MNLTTPQIQVKNTAFHLFVEIVMWWMGIENNWPSNPAQNQLQVKTPIHPLFLSKELEKSIHISKIIEGASLDFSTIKIMPTGTSRLDVPYGDYWIAVGDAAFSFDPISSYGITSALGSGFYVGHALACQLLKEEDAMTTYRYVLENIFEVYLEKLRNHYALEHRWKEKPYWKNRLSIVASAKKEIKL